MSTLKSLPPGEARAFAFAGRPWGETMAEAANDPARALGVALALLRGRLFLLRCRLLGRRVTGGTGLRISGRLVWRGPGTLVLGDDVHVGSKAILQTLSPQAVIEVGAHTFLNGTRCGCMQRIRIGSWCLVGPARIMDTDFHSIQANRHDPAAPVRVIPVEIADNAWIGAFAGILPGTKIGKNSVVGYGAVCVGEYPGDVVIAGNPARVLRTLSGEAVAVDATASRVP
jgi:acetyltransferase-like isoleucine patch superfamily enzyme